MNFFPNLQIHVYTGEETRRRNRVNVNTATGNSSNGLQTMMNTLRQEGVDMVSTGVPNNGEDLQIYLGFETQAPATQGLLMEDLNQHTELFVYTENESNEPICSICRNNFCPNDICRKITNCHHYFHQACVDSWIVRNQTCPMCRNLIVPRSQN